MEESCDTYFIRHGPGLGVIDEAVRDLYKKNIVAVHFPEVQHPKTPPNIKDSMSRDLADYSKPGAKRAIEIVNELDKYGGIIWAEYRTSECVKIGKIKPKTFKWYYTFWRKGVFPYKREAILKSLPMECVQEINPSEEPYCTLDKAKPRRAAISRWPKGRQLRNLLKC
jgi:hypothetical protein